MNPTLSTPDRRRSHPAVELVALLKACAKQKDLSRGRRLHAGIRKAKGLLRNVHVGSALVNMYARCGEVGEAEEVLEGLPVRGTEAWNALIAGYGKHGGGGSGEEAAMAYEKMQQEGVMPNAVTMTSTLRACGNNNLKRGIRIHAQMMMISASSSSSSSSFCGKSLSSSNHILGTALLHMYISNHAISQAELVFEELPTRDIVSWTTLIAGLCQMHLNQKALACLPLMLHEGLSPDSIAFSWFLKASGNIGAIAQGLAVHAELVRKGFLFLAPPVAHMALVHMYSGCGSISMAREVFAELPMASRNVASWTVLISANSENGLDEDALDCFERMQCEGFCPDGVSFTAAIQIVGAIDKGIRMHARIHDAPESLFFYRNTNLRTALLDMYSRCGSLVETREAFDNILRTSSDDVDAASWTAMIAGYVRHGCGSEAIRCFERMQGEGLLPDAITWACVLKACSSVEESRTGNEVYAKIRWGERWLEENNVILATALVDMLCKCGAMARARQVAEELHSVSCWNALISGYSHHGLPAQALECFQRLGEMGIYPDVLTLGCILKACWSTGAIRMGHEIHLEMVKEGLAKRDCMLDTALMNMYARCGALIQAQAVFEEISERDVVSWTVLITGYDHCGRHGEALSCFQRMRHEGLAPDAVTLLSVLSAVASCSASGHMGSLLLLLYYLDSLCSAYRIPRIRQHYACVVHHLGRAGRLDKALQIIDSVQQQDTAAGSLWFTLLAACRQLGSTVIGQFAFEYTIHASSRILAINTTDESMAIEHLPT